MKIRAAGLILIVMLLGAVGAQGQDGYEPVFVSEFGLYNISWRIDSNAISFQEGLGNIGLTGENNNWHEYSVISGNQTSSSIWPQPYFLPEEMPLGLFTAPESLQNSFTFLSPGGRFIAYLSDAPDDLTLCAFVTIADTEQFSGYAISNSTLCSTPDFNSSYQVLWSDDGAAFVMRHIYFENRTFYVTDYAESVDEVTSIRLENLVIGDEGFYLIQPFDLNEDGSQLLMSGGIFENNTTRSTQLLLWTPESPDEYVIIFEGPSNFLFAGAAFSPDNQRIWYIDRNGLHEYDLATEQTRMLTADVNATWVDAAYFSPDGQYVALVRREGPSRQEVSLYVEPMAQWLIEEDA